MTTAQTPLAGIRVLDIGTMLAGPWAAAVLAEPERHKILS